MTGNLLSHHPSTTNPLLVQVNAAGTLKTLSVDVASLSAQDVRLLHTLSNWQKKPILEIGSLQLPEPRTLEIQPYLWDEGTPVERQLHQYLEANRKLARQWEQQLSQENGQHIALACILGGLFLLTLGNAVANQVAAAGLVQVLLSWLSNDISRMLLGLGIAGYGCVLMHLHHKEKPALLDVGEQRRIRTLSKQILRPG